MGTNLELGYHHGECYLYSNAEVSITEVPKQLQLQKNEHGALDANLRFGRTGLFSELC